MLNSHLIKDAGAAGAPRGPPRPPLGPPRPPFQFNLCASVNGPGWRVVRFVNLPLFQHKRRGGNLPHGDSRGWEMDGPARALQSSGGQRQARRDGATADYWPGGGSNYSLLFMPRMDFAFPACIFWVGFWALHQLLQNQPLKYVSRCFP